MKKNILAVISLLLAIALCGCGTTAVPQSTPAPSPTPTTVATPSPTPMPTPTPTPIPSPTPTPTHTLDYDKVNQQIQDFLNKEGDYDPDNRLYKAQLCIELDLDGTVYDLETTSLDYQDPGYGCSTSQGWLFGYIVKDENIIMAVGFDGNDRNRFITAINIPMGIFKDYNGFYFSNMDQWREATRYSGLPHEYTIEGVKKYLDMKIDKPVFFNFQVLKSSQELREQVGEEYEGLVDFFDEKAPLSYSLIRKTLRDEVGYKFKDNGIPIVELNDISELKDLNPNTLPCCYCIEAVFEKREISGKQLADFFE